MNLIDCRIYLFVKWETLLQSSAKKSTSGSWLRVEEQAVDEEKKVEEQADADGK